MKRHHMYNYFLCTVCFTISLCYLYHAFFVYANVLLWIFWKLKPYDKGTIKNEINHAKFVSIYDKETMAPAVINVVKALEEDNYV